MADEQKTQQGQTQQAQVKSKSSLIKVDKAKTNEQYIAEVEAYYIIPKLVREKFPDLVKLVFETESMDEDEREYWLQILPIMTDDQINKFREILVNEKEQLEKLDKEYDSEMTKLEQKRSQALNETEIRKRREELHVKEAAEEQQESKTEEDLLNKLKNL